MTLMWATKRFKPQLCIGLGQTILPQRVVNLESEIMNELRNLFGDAARKAKSESGRFFTHTHSFLFSRQHFIILIDNKFTLMNGKLSFFAVKLLYL